MSNLVKAFAAAVLMTGAATAAEFGADIDRAPSLSYVNQLNAPAISTSEFSSHINFEGHTLTVPMKAMTTAFASHSMSACDAGKCPTFNFKSSAYTVTSKGAELGFAKDPSLAMSAVRVQ